MKSHQKHQRNNFVRGVRAETSLRCYTTALGYVLTRDRDQAIRLINERIDFERKELAAVNTRRAVGAQRAESNGYENHD